MLNLRYYLSFERRGTHGTFFGELTFTPSAGLDTGRLPETDLLFGSLVKLPTDQEG